MSQTIIIKKRSYKKLYEQCKKWYASALWESADPSDKKNLEATWSAHNWLLSLSGFDPIPYPSGDEILIRLASRGVSSYSFISKVMDISEEELKKKIEKNKDQWFVK